MLVSILVHLDRLFLGEHRIVVALDTPARESERDGVLAGGDALLERGLVEVPAVHNLLVGRTPRIDCAHGVDELSDLLLVRFGVGITLDLRYVADDEHEAAVEFRPLFHWDDRELEALRLAGINELRRTHSKT